MPPFTTTSTPKRRLDGHRGLGPGGLSHPQTALDAIQAGDMFVAEENGRLVATAKINQEQVPEYAEAA